MLGQLIFLTFFVVSTISLDSVPPCTSNSLSVQVNTSRGLILGCHFSNGNNRDTLYYGEGDLFLGIPYVQPPVGQLRYAKPEPMTKLPSNPFNATAYAPACPQLDFSNTYPVKSEDCLYLNIFTPKAISIYKYPVMLWIHGGFFKSGSAMDFSPMGAVRNLVSRGVVVVTIQYRLGVLGFFTTFTNDFVPNLGLLDQVEAIKWVRDEIPNFGGDPYRITLFGESAGSASVSAHTYSPVSQNLFQQAILESGTALTCFDGALGYDGLSYSAASVLCDYTLADWNSGNFTALKQCMMNLTIDQINNQWMINEAFNLMGWRMVQDNYFMPDVPRVLFKNRPNIPVIIGTNKDEWAAMELAFILLGIKKFDTYNSSWLACEFSVLASYLNQSESINTLSLLEGVYVPYGLSEEDHLGWLKASVAVFTAAAFTGFATRDIEYYLYSNNTQVYAYEFDYASYVGFIGDRLKGYEDAVIHGAELPFVWMRETDWMNATASGRILPTDRGVGDFFGETWTNFAKYGRPTLDGSWQPVFSPTAQNYLSINATNEMRTFYRNIDRVIWNQAIPSQVGHWPPEDPDYNNGTHVHEVPSSLDCVLGSIGAQLDEEQQRIFNMMTGRYRINI